jgi:hypothetical protein
MPARSSRRSPGGTPPRSEAAPATITPEQNILVLNPGQTHSETIVVTIPPGPPILNVQLVATGQTAPFVTSINPAAGSGPLPPNQPNTVQFEVLFTGVAPCKENASQVFTGTLDVVVTFGPAAGTTVPPQQVVARKRVRITVPECQPQPEPLFSYSVKFVCGVQEECQCACAPVRPGAYATEINIYNYQSREAHVRKHVVPVVFSGAVVGREPDYAKTKAVDAFVLPGRTATMDDCCRIHRLLLGAEPGGPQPLTIGFLEIVSDRELVVSAVYTASDLKGGSISIEVEEVRARRSQ